ncbi:hypothetical protein M0R19_07115 [Candidatus Pacearchaeota archaeon]|nr:hypothetical protein [Candidatus Pacearchaeota archaeon]
MIKADLKHWGGRRKVNGPYEINYEQFVKQSYDKLGKGGVVGIPNARGPDNPLGPEYRFEELYELAKKSGSITPLGDGRVFQDNKHKIWFVKSQEINSQFDGKKLTYLIFNIPFGENLNEMNNKFLSNLNTINILNLPSCSEQINLPIHYLSYLSGVIVHSSSTAILIGANKNAEKFYNNFVKGGFFFNLNNIHNIGAIAVSGGHRCPKEGLIKKIISPISVGSSYTLLPEFKGKNLDEFNEWLKTSIENSQDTNKLVKGSSVREMVLGHILKLY